MSYEDLSTAKIAERYVAGWLAHVAVIVLPETQSPLQALDFGFGAGQTTPVAEEFTLTDERNGSLSDNGVESI